jgi:hypothetical protein
VPTDRDGQNSSMRAHSSVWMSRSSFGVKPPASCRRPGISSCWTTCQRCSKSSSRVVFHDHRIQNPDHARNGRPHPLPISPAQNPILRSFAKGSYII